MKAKKILALVLTLCMVVSLFPAVYAAPADALSFADAELSYIECKLDGQDIKVAMYEDLYLANTTHEDQKVAVYVPEGATADSPIMLMVNNSGWQSNSYSGRNGVKNYGIEQGFRGEQIVGDYKSASNTDAVGRAIAEGYVIVSYGCRSRNNGASEDGTYNGHSPATMSDTKAVIRYLRYNADLLPAGDTEKIVVTGTSGGGALSVVIAASGDSKDYFPSLFESGAAGIVKNSDGTYSSTISDSVWATIAYCPITDLGNACAAYEWTWSAARDAYIASGAQPGGMMAPSYAMGAEKMAEATEVLTAAYVEYIDSLGIEAVNSENLKATIIEMMEAEIVDAMAEFGVDKMKADLGDATWLTFNEDGTFTYDYDAHCVWVGTQSAFKAPSAFSNTGMSAWKGNMNEDNLFGTTADDYSPFNEYAWNNDDTENAVGKDDTGLTWDEYMATEAGKALALQIKMTNGIAYLLDGEGESQSAENWYVRYGMADRDSSFAVEAVLAAAMKDDATIADANFEYAWLEGHGGNYDVDEAYMWLADKLDAFSVKGAEETNTFDVTVDGETVSITRYNDYYYSAAEGDTTSVGPGKYGPKGDRDDCQLSIYVPEGANADSAVMFLIENGSWAQTGFKEAITAGQAFDSTEENRVALALAHDMIVVSYGARCRGSVDAEGNYIHAPQMVVDTKAAIRYVKYNIEQGLIPGDADKVIISGHSGGGALTAIIAATGNSPDYEEYLVNAAPATDDVLATMSSAPITDLAYADFAYEWTFGDYRDELPGHLTYKDKGCDMELSAALAARYVPYIESMFGMTEEEYTAKIAELFAASVQHEIDLDEEFQYSDIRPEDDTRGFFTLDEDGDVASFDLETYTQWLVNNAGTAAYSGNEMKGVIAFNGEKVEGGYMRNENNLWGADDQVASVAYEELWDKADLKAMGIDEYKSWDAFWAAEGDMLAKQMKSVSVMPYLTGSDDAWYLDGVETSDECDVAPYWFIRHGMGDADTSYATVASLIFAVEEKAEDVNAYFGWERNHNGGGNTYYQEFFQWIEDKGIVPEINMDVQVSNQKITVGGEAVDAEIYNIDGSNYFKLRDIAMLLKGTDAEFSIDFDNAKKEVYINTDGKYVAVGGELVKAGDKSDTCASTNWTIYVDGEEVAVKVYLIGGNNYFKLRDLGAAVGFAVDYDAATRTIQIL